MNAPDMLLISDHQMLVMEAGFTIFCGSCAAALMGYVVWSLFWIAFDAFRDHCHKRKVRRQATDLVRKHIIRHDSRDCWRDQKWITRP